MEGLIFLLPIVLFLIWWLKSEQEEEEARIEREQSMKEFYEKTRVLAEERKRLIQEMKTRYPRASVEILMKLKREALWKSTWTDNDLYEYYCTHKEEFEKIEEKKRKEFYGGFPMGPFPLIHLQTKKQPTETEQERKQKEAERAEQERKRREKERIEAEQRRIRQEREREEAEKREKESALNQISNAVRSWNKAQGILPIYNLFYYYPTTCTNVYIDSDKQQVRKLIWNFKDGKGSVNYKVEKVLRHFFGDRLKYVTFVCIPASNLSTNSMRYRDFSQNLCKSLFMENAFNYITIVRDKQPKHLGGGEDYDYFTLNTSFFKGKTVILFDDVTTRGNSMVIMKDKLESMGASVLCGITLGKTVHQDMGIDPYYMLN